MNSLRRHLFSTDLATPMPRSSRFERRTIILITVAFALLLGFWAALTPMFRAPDETAHFDAAVRIADGEGWPAPGDAYIHAAISKMESSAPSTPPVNRPSVAQMFETYPGLTQSANQMTQHPPTYYAAAAVVLKVFDFSHLRWDHAFMLLRFFDVFIVAPLPLFLWMSLRRLTRSPRVAIAGAMVPFAVPQLAQIGSSVTNDAPIILLGGVITWLAIRIMTGDSRLRTLLGLGAALGVACATKGTALPLIVFVVLALLIPGRAALPWTSRILRLVIAGVVTLLLSGWWWIHNVLTYHTLQPDGIASKRPKVPWEPGSTANWGAFVNQMWNGMSSTFWGQFGPARYPMSPVVSDTLTVLVIFALVVYGFRRRDNLWISITLVSAPLMLLLSLSLTVWNSYEDTQGINGVQGRYLYPGLVASIALSALAWRRFMATPYSRRKFGQVIALGAPGIGVYGITVAYRGFFQGTNLGVTRDGVAHLLFTTPIGRIPFALLGVAFVIVGLVAVWHAWRAASNPRLTAPVLTTQPQSAPLPSA